MESAMQIISIDQRVRSDTVQDLNGFNSHSLSRQAKKGKQIASLLPAFKKTF